MSYAYRMILAQGAVVCPVPRGRSNHASPWSAWLLRCITQTTAPGNQAGRVTAAGKGVCLRGQKTGGRTGKLPTFFWLANRRRAY